ncbi:MAG: DUF1565 domain-containing protein [Spirochaetes bacterium]|nr:DUF1565 domain-containing protein [Spirochaetota bacterium]
MNKNRIFTYGIRALLLVLMVLTACGGESYWRDLKDGSSSNSLPPSFPVGMYVSTTGNDVTGDGSPDNPFQTIQHGITRANTDGLHAVFVEAGTYNISAEIVLLEGISLYGGFRPGYWNDRDETARWVGSIYRTAIVSSAARALRGTGVITSATIVEGFVIYGPTAFYNENNSNPRITNNTIIGTGVAEHTVQPDHRDGYERRQRVRHLYYRRRQPYHNNQLYLWFVSRYGERCHDGYL